jgi:hypothetical protein
MPAQTGSQSTQKTNSLSLILDLRIYSTAIAHEQNKNPPSRRRMSINSNTPPLIERPLFS